jgi:hypothetical protein
VLPTTTILALRMIRDGPLLYQTHRDISSGSV